MTDILNKEIKLSSSILSFLFIGFGLMFFIPNYPILCGVFFVTLGIFQSYQHAREANDILFSALLPIAKRDVVKGKFIFTCFIELCGFLVMVIATLIRMTILSDVNVYRSAALMNANPFALGVALVIFGLYNFIFVRGFFKTSYKFAKPFVSYIIVSFVTIILAESLHHVPGLGVLNAFGYDHLPLQSALLAAGAIVYVLLTYVAYRASAASFEKIDL